MKSMSYGVPMMLKITELSKGIGTVGRRLSAGNRLFFGSSCRRSSVGKAGSRPCRGIAVFFL